MIDYIMKSGGDGRKITGVFTPSIYPDGMPLVKEWPVAHVDSVLLRPRHLGELMEGLFWVDAIAARGGSVRRLILPFFPGARQDRLNASGDYLFTAKSVADEVNRRCFDEVVVVDPHSDVVPALVERCRAVSLASFLRVPAGKYAAVVSPDAGAEKRAGAVARKLGVPLLHAWKTRDVQSGAISGFGMEPTELPSAENPVDSTVLVVDDICDGGGTFVGLAAVLKFRGLKAHLLTTHGIYSQGTAKLLEFYGHLYCTDSFRGPRDGVIEIPVCQNLLHEIGDFAG